MASKGQEEPFYLALALALCNNESSLQKGGDLKILVHSCINLVLWQGTNFSLRHGYGQTKLFPSRHLVGVLGPSPSPWGTSTSARPGTDLRAFFIEDILLGIAGLVI